jgi:O-methyltransferase involved in polyketide biosynthesis
VGDTMPSFSEKIANTGMYTLLCKARVLLFPDRYVHIQGKRFLEHYPNVVLKDDVLVAMVRLLVKNYQTEFRDLEHKYFGNTWLFDSLQTTSFSPAPVDEAVMEKELLLTILTREKFFRKQASLLIKTENIQQILILGSGLDSFSIRKQKYTQQSGVRFFEFDRAEPLDLKQELLEELYGHTNATYVRGSYLDPDSFENLRRVGLDVSKPTLVVWGGNTMYLAKEQIQNVMSQLSSIFSGSNLFMTFDYLHPSAVYMQDAIVADENHHGTLLQNMLEGFKRTFNIQFSSGFMPSELPEFCKRSHFSIWNNQHLTASQHVKSLKLDEDPVYTEDYYSYVTLQNKCP